MLCHPIALCRLVPASPLVGTVGKVPLCSLPVASEDGNGMWLWQLIRSNSPDVWLEYKAIEKRGEEDTF